MLKRYVLDTNVLISAVLAGASPAAQAFRLALRSGVLLRSDKTLQEFAEVLARPKFAPYVIEGQRIAFIEDFILAAEYVAIHEAIVACRDAKDDMFLELAVNGKADMLVTGDKDLLALHPYRGIPIITVREFLDSAI
jgi:uncharacterized protein